LQLVYDDRAEMYIKKLSLIFERGKRDLSFKDVEPHLLSLKFLKSWIIEVLNVFFIDSISPHLQMLQRKYSSSTLQADQRMLDCNIHKTVREQLKQTFHKKCSTGSKAELNFDTFQAWVCPRYKTLYTTLDDENNVMKTLESLQLESLELLDNSTTLNTGDDLIFYGHDVRGGEDTEIYDNRKPFPCIVAAEEEEEEVSS
jgi:hypothetical protein